MQAGIHVLRLHIAAVTEHTGFQSDCLRDALMQAHLARLSILCVRLSKIREGGCPHAAEIKAYAVHMQDIQAGRAALKRVDAEQLQQQRKLQQPKEDSLEARLREGLAKFRFDDTAGSLNGDNTGGFSS